MTICIYTGILVGLEYCLFVQNLAGRFCLDSGRDSFIVAIPLMNLLTASIKYLYSYKIKILFNRNTIAIASADTLVLSCYPFSQEVIKPKASDVK